MRQLWSLEYVSIALFCSWEHQWITLLAVEADLHQQLNVPTKKKKKKKQEKKVPTRWVTAGLRHLSLTLGKAKVGVEDWQQ